MKTDIVPTWTTNDEIILKHVASLVWRAHKKIHRLDRKISIQYLESQIEDPQTDAITSLKACLEDAICEIEDFETAAKARKN